MNRRNQSTIILCGAALGVMASSARADVTLAQERFFGRGTRGPYAISRQAVEPRTETILKNGIFLSPDTDFQFDPDMGIIAFSEPIRVTDIVDVDYRYDTTKAHAAQGIAGSFGLLSSNVGGVGLTYTFKADANGNQSLSGLGFTGKMDFGHAAMNSTFMMDETQKNAGAEGQNVQLGLKQDTGRLKFNASFAKVGKMFTQADAMKLIKGSEALNLNGSFQLTSNAMLTANRVDTTTPDASGIITTKSDTNGGLAMTLSNASKFTALHDQQTITVAGVATSTDTDHLQLDQKLNTKTLASLVQDTVTTGTGGTDVTTKATKLNLSTSGANGLSVQTALAMTDSSAAGAGRDASVNVAQGDAKNKMSLALSDHTGSGGDATTDALNYQHTMGTMQMTASRTDNRTDAGNNSATTVGMNLAATKTVKIVANYAGNDVVGTGATQTTGLNVSAKPNDKMQLSAAMADTTAAAGVTQNRSATLTVTPVKNKLNLSTGYQSQTNPDGSAIQIAMLQADIKPMDAMAMSGTYKSREGTSDQPDTMNAQVTLKPIKAFQLTGTYACNPEDASAAIQRLVRRGVSLQSTLGCLTFSGGYITEQSLLDDSMGAHAEFKLGLKLSKNSQLQTGFQQTIGACTGFTQTMGYNVNYTHDIGSDFHLLLDANVLEHDNTVPIAQREEVKATANLGIKF